jgi:hypothetical protein
MANKIQAELKSLFSILVQAMIGPAGQQGHESFDFMLCTPEWFASNIENEIELGRHYLFVQEFNHARLVNFVRDYCATCTVRHGRRWQTS